MATIQKFEDLEVWQKARAFAKHIFDSVNVGSFSKDFELRGQIKRSSGSIMIGGLINYLNGSELTGRKFKDRVTPTQNSEPKTQN
jgi:four helix bundle protein